MLTNLTATTTPASRNAATAALVERLALIAAHRRDHPHTVPANHAHHTETIFFGPQRCIVICHCCPTEIPCLSGAEALRVAASHAGATDDGAMAA